MNSRQRGALWILVALVAGRVLDRFDLPFEHHDTPSLQAREDSTPAAPQAAADSTPIPGASRPAATRSAAAASAATASAANPVRINHASAADLQRLPGVGPVLAGRIVAQRDAQGPFHSLEDLARVRGLGPKTCARLAPLVRFD